MEKGLRNISTTSQLLTHLSPYLLMTRRTTTRIICNTLFIISCLYFVRRCKCRTIIVTSKGFKRNFFLFLSIINKNNILRLHFNMNQYPFMLIQHRTGMNKASSDRHEYTICVKNIKQIKHYQEFVSLPRLRTDTE